VFDTGVAFDYLLFFSFLSFCCLLRSLMAVLRSATLSPASPPISYNPPREPASLFSSCPILTNSSFLLLLFSLSILSFPPSARTSIYIYTKTHYETNSKTNSDYPILDLFSLPLSVSCAYHTSSPFIALSFYPHHLFLIASSFDVTLDC
jgi:hypothetical protein